MLERGKRKENIFELVELSMRSLPMLGDPNIADSIGGEKTGYGLYCFVVVVTTISGYNDPREVKATFRYK